MTTRRAASVVCVMVLAGASAPAPAMERIEEIVVSATRMDESLASVGNAISVVDGEDVQLGRQQLGLDESLNRVPGLFFQNRYNFTQDLRISVRGFGARANFGIRGIKIFIDDLPVTLADGQSGVDDIDLGSVDRIEVLRGPSSSLYGSSSGGVMSLYTEDGPETPFLEGTVTLGEYDHQKYQLKTGGQHGQLNYLINGSYLLNDGYRDHAEVEHALVNSKFRYDFQDDADLTVIFNLVDSPKAEDAGGLDQADADADRRQAQERNLSSDAGEELDQQRFGWIYRRALNEQHQLTFRNYYTWRDFQTFLPIGTHIPFVADDGVVEFDRFFYGGGGQYSYTGELLGRPDRFTAGFDIDVQEDDRQRFLNNAGIKGALVFDQIEEAESYGFYFRNTLAVTDTVEFTLGGRYDIVDLSVDDNYLLNGDQSAKLDFDEFSPTVGLTWHPREDMLFYANYATAFETPTFTELANPARELNVNLGGFSNVSAQTADSFEVGARGTFADRVYYDLAVYTMQVDDEVTNTINIGSRSFFENADTDRNGFEAQFVVDLFEGLQWTVAYTYSDFEFDRFPADPSIEGNELPGLPENQFYTELAYHHRSGFYAAWDLLVVDDFYLDNANTDETDAYTVSNLRLGHRFEVAELKISPFLGVNNLFDEDYYDNVRVNAFGGRYFEPAPEINVYGGISVRYDF